MIPLSHLLDAPQEHNRLVAFGREGERKFLDLRRDVASLAARLAPAQGRELLLHCDDAYAFAVGLLAAAQVGARAVLPPSRQPGALQRLATEVFGTLIDVQDPPDALAGLPCWHPLENAAAAREPFRVGLLAPLDRDAPIATLFTSGTTGAASRVRKAVRHLEDEVAVLERCFGALLGDGTRILATVAPQHLYGLLFRVLWPLSSGRPFLRSALLHPEELAPHADDPSPFAVVTTPSTLRHLIDRGALSRRAGGCRAVFSSGGALAAEQARGAAKVLGAPPWEIYGSTETGGVALRQQHRADEPWRPLPGVELAADPESGCLIVTSPFVSVGVGAGEPVGENASDSTARARFTVGDRVAFAEGRCFHLLGRADRVIKVGERRLSLPDMEGCLRAHPAVDEAVLIALESASGETRVGAAVVPAAHAWDALAASGRRALAKTLSEHLAPDFERVLLPRAWRFVAALPRDPQGKLPAAALRALFESDSTPRAPERLAVRREGGTLEARLRIPWDLTFLDGHFPSFPVVAGVAQVHFAMIALEELTGEAPRLETLEALKFHEMLRPGQEAILRVQVQEDGARFRFSLEDAAHSGRIFSSGRGTLGRPT